MHLVLNLFYAFYLPSLRFDLPTREIDSESKRKATPVVCHNCGEHGHKASACVNQPISTLKEVSKESAQIKSQI